MSLNNQPNNVQGTPATGITNWLGSHIRKKNMGEIARYPEDYSKWFPYGTYGLGGCYHPDGLKKELEKISDTELGAKGLRLRAIVAGVVLGLTGAGFSIKSSMENPAPKIGTSMTTPTKK